MKSNIFTIMKKELARFFGDRRLFFSAVLLPGVMIYVMYSFMGSAMGSLFGGGGEAPKIAVQNMPASVAALFQAQELPYDSLGPAAGDADAVKKQIAAKDADLLLVFPAGFDALAAAYDIQSGAPAPQVAVYYNGADTDSSELFARVTALLDAYESTLANKFDVNAGGGAYDLASKKDLSGMMFSSLMPLLLTIFLFSGCMAIAPESIAGEKERGTLSTLLVTPLRRSELALGKIFAITIIAALSAVSSTLGTILALPRLLGDVGGEEMQVRAYYTPADYLLLALVILSTVLLFVTLIAVLSALAKSTKEAQTLIMPLMVVVMLVAVSGMFGSAPASPLPYLIPVYNSVQCMSAVFSFQTSPLAAAVTVISNFVYCGLLTLLLAKLFNSEKIMFAR